MKKIFLLLVLFVSCSHAPKPGSYFQGASASATPRILFDGDVDSDTVMAFEAQLDAANAAGAKRVIVEINTPGGSVGAGMKMSKAIERSGATVICVVDGMAASMGLYILQSCDVRLMTSRSLLMGHEPATSVRGQPDDIEATKELLVKLNHALTFHIVRRMTLTVAEYEARVAHRHEWWMTCDEALAVGAVDGVVLGVRGL